MLWPALHTTSLIICLEKKDPGGNSVEGNVPQQPVCCACARLTAVLCHMMQDRYPPKQSQIWTSHLQHY